MSKKEVILITGSTGFLGSNLLNQLGSNYNVVEFKGDITNFDNVKKQINPNINKIIHLAGLISGTDKDLIKVNILGTLNLLEALKELNLPDLNLFLTIGSASEYSPSQEPIGEKSLKSPLSMYGKTKLMASELVESWFNYSKTPTIILRPFNIIGQGQPFRMLPRKLEMFFNTDEDVVKVQNVNVEAVRDWIDVRDVCKCIETLLTLDKIDTFVDLNLANGVPVSNIELIKVFAKVWSKKFIYTESNFPSDTLVADINKLKKILPKFKPRFSLLDSVEEIKKYSI